LIAIVDLRGYIEGTRTPINDRSRVLLARQAGSSVGLLVDEVLGQRNITDENIPLETGDEDERYERYITRQYDLGEKIFGIFSMAQLVKSPDFIQAAG
jgi:twitching motility protein PilI